MRTTVDIHGPLLERAKALASERGRRLADIVNDALREMFDRRARQATESNKQAPLPLSRVGKSGTRPGIDLSDNAATADFLGDSEGQAPDLSKLR
ncbi:MAG: hypothetical protein V3W41_18080 [Planctomycetota bacterium]